MKLAEKHPVLDNQIFSPKKVRAFEHCLGQLKELCKAGLILSLVCLLFRVILVQQSYVTVEITLHRHIVEFK